MMNSELPFDAQSIQSFVTSWNEYMKSSMATTMELRSQLAQLMEDQSRCKAKVKTLEDEVYYLKRLPTREVSVSIPSREPDYSRSSRSFSSSFSQGRSLLVSRKRHVVKRRRV